MVGSARVKKAVTLEHRTRLTLVHRRVHHVMHRRWLKCSEVAVGTGVCRRRRREERIACCLRWRRRQREDIISECLLLLNRGTEHCLLSIRRG